MRHCEHVGKVVKAWFEILPNEHDLMSISHICSIYSHVSESKVGELFLNLRHLQNFLPRFLKNLLRFLENLLRFLENLLRFFRNLPRFFSAFVRITK